MQIVETISTSSPPEVTSLMVSDPTFVFRWLSQTWPRLSSPRSATFPLCVPSSSYSCHSANNTATNRTNGNRHLPLLFLPPSAHLDDGPDGESTQIARTVLSSRLCTILYCQLTQATKHKAFIYRLLLSLVVDMMTRRHLGYWLSSTLMLMVIRMMMMMMMISATVLQIRRRNCYQLPLRVKLSK